MKKKEEEQEKRLKKKLEFKEEMYERGITEI